MRDEPQAITGKLARARSAHERGRLRVAEVVKANHSLAWERNGWTYELERAPWDKANGERHAAVYDLRVTAGGTVIFRDRVQCWDGSPVMVPDGTVDLEGSPNFREDPVEAARIDLEHTVKVVTKGGREPWVKSKPGTVSTFYSGTGDGYLSTFPPTPTFATAIASAGDVNTSATTIRVESTLEGDGDFLFRQSFIGWDTSAISDTDEVSAATISLYGTFTDNTDSPTIEARGLISFGTLTTADWQDPTDLAGLAELATFAHASVSTSAYNDFTSTNLAANINLTGLTEIVLAHDLMRTSTEPTGFNRALFSSADETGTTQDPKLVVTHEAAGKPFRRSLLGVGF